MILDKEFIWEKISNPSKEQMDFYIKNSKPFLLINMVNQWPAFCKWKNINYLLEKIGSETVIPLRKNVDNFKYNIGKEWLGDTVYMKFEEFIKYWFKIEENNNNDNIKDSFYLASLPINKYFPSLIEDIIIPLYPKEQKKSGNLWIGNSGQITPVHYDFSTGDPGMDGIHAVIKGKKKFLLFDPEYNASFFPRKHQWGRFHQAIVNSNGLPNQELYPNFKNAKYIEIELKEGEALFIPKLWWHHVITLEQSISVNFWFQHIESEKLKLTKHWNHMVEYLKCIEKMEISKEKMKNVLQFYGMKVTDNDIQYYIDNPHQFMLLPQFLHTFSNGTRSPWMINLPESQQFAKEIEFKIKEWILSRIYK